METVRRTSKKRQAIFDALCDSKAHPSAEMLYKQLKSSIPDLSLGTVYRNLGVLVQDGLAVRVANVCGEDRFDACTVPHTHLICTSCGKVQDADIAFPSPEYAELEGFSGWSISTHSLCFSGVCNDCLERSVTSHIN